MNTFPRDGRGVDAVVARSHSGTFVLWVVVAAAAVPKGRAKSAKCHQKLKASSRGEQMAMDLTRVQKRGGLAVRARQRYPLCSATRVEMVARVVRVVTKVAAREATKRVARAARAARAARVAKVDAAGATMEAAAAVAAAVPEEEKEGNILLARCLHFKSRAFA